MLLQQLTPPFLPVTSTRFFRTNQEVRALLDRILEKLKAFESRPSLQSELDSFSAPLPDSDAEGIKFLKFDIDIASPVLLLPVHYRSMHYLQLRIDRVHAANYFKGEEEDDPLCQSDQRRIRRMQYYNNCNIKIENINLVSSLPSDKADLTASPAIELSINVRWPVGDIVERIVPRWSINCVFGKVKATLRRKDYALLCHVIFENVCGVTRNLEEWAELQQKRRMAGNSLVEDKDAFVLYEYDVKNGRPTTYAFVVNVADIELDFIEDDEIYGAQHQGVANVHCRDLRWSLTKGKDLVTNQVLSCGSITLRQTSKRDELSAFDVLLLPLEDCTGVRKSSSFDIEYSIVEEGGDDMDPSSSIPVRDNSTSIPELLYTSTSKPTGENVKSLYIHDACIYLIYPAWVTLKNYFTNLPPAQILSVADASSIISVNGDFFSTGVEAKPLEADLSIKGTGIEEPFTDFQFRLLLAGARLVLPADSSSSAGNDCKGVTLRLDADCLYERVEGTREGNTDIFINGLELFTGAAKNPRRYSRQSSLIYPLGVRVKKKACGNNGSSLEVDVDVIRARAKFSDMSLAIDVGTQLINAMKEGQVTQDKAKKARDDPQLLPQQSETSLECGTSTSAVHCSGLSLLIIDNSERHFIGSKELLKVTLADIFFKETINNVDQSIPERHSQSSCTELILRKLKMIDHLQPKNSPFRLGACSYDDGAQGGAGMADEEDEDDVVGRFSWKQDSIKQEKTWGYARPGTVFLGNSGHSDGATRADNLITVRKTKSASSGTCIDIQCNTLLFQWNPSTVIALQRFLGRLKKEAIRKISVLTADSKKTPRGVDTTSLKKFHHGSGSDSQGHRVIGETQLLNEGTNGISSDKISLTISLKSLAICLNKEHQGRRLLRLDLKKIYMQLVDDGGSKSVEASIHSCFAADPSRALHEMNRRMLYVIDGDGCNGEKVNWWHSLMCGRSLRFFF